MNFSMSMLLLMKVTSVFDVRCLSEVSRKTEGNQNNYKHVLKKFGSFGCFKTLGSFINTISINLNFMGDMGTLDEHLNV